MDYVEKLKDPRWQKKRLEVFERDGWSCKACRRKDRTLHVHHLFYFKDTEPWEINNGFLVTLCEDCHKDNTLREMIGMVLDTIWKQGYGYTELVEVLNKGKNESEKS